jgi:hypothetical protein
MLERAQRRALIIRNCRTRFIAVAGVSVALSGKAP